MARLSLPALTRWITAAALEHPRDLADEVARRAGVGRATAQKALRQLVDAGWLVRGGARNRPTYAPGALREVVRQYPLTGLSEDGPWRRDFAPCLALPAHVQRMLQHAFTELVNNAIDHSEGRSVTVSVRQTPTQVQLLVSDDGRGLFDQIHARFAIDDPVMAMLELAKGKLTSAPDRHTGRGLYFTARLADVFDLHANDAAFQRRQWTGDAWHAGRPLPHQGTSIYLAISLATTRTLDEVMKAASQDGQGYGFERTTVPLRLIGAGGQGLESRGQAKHVASRLTEFLRAELDFEGVDDVGHGFADELFRVFQRAHPQVDLVPTNMAPRVAAMIAAVREQRA